MRPILVFWVWSCQPPGLLVLDSTAIPADVDWVAALPITEAGPASGTPLISSKSEVSWSLRRADTLTGREWLVGWPTESLEAPNEAELRARPIEPATSADPLLPLPAWQAELVEGMLTPDSRTNPLTTAWLPPCGAPELVDFRCSVCPVEVAAYGCDIVVNLEGCGLGHVAFDLRGTTASNLRTDQLADCVSSAVGPDEHFRVECRNGSLSCQLRGYGAPPELPWVRAEAQLEDESLGLPWIAAPDQRFGPRVLGFGTLVGDSLLVPGYGGPSCRGKTTIHEIDVSSMEVTSTATISGCLVKLLNTPSGLWAFDPSGRVVRLSPELEVKQEFLVATDEDWQAADLAVSDARGALLQSKMRSSRAKLFEVNLDRGEVERSFDVQEDGHLVVPLAGGRWGVLGGNIIQVVEAGAPGPERVCSSTNFEASDYLEVGAHTMVASVDPHGAVFMVPGLTAVQLCSVAAPIEVSGMVTSIEPWGREIVASITQRETAESWVSRVDPAEARFLPGSVFVGKGNVQLVSVNDSVLLAVLLESGRVVRLTR